MKTFFIETLGCSRNLVDSEVVAYQLEKAGFQQTSLEKARFILVNTCAFIEPAREESIQTLFELKNTSPHSQLVVLGCLAQRSGSELFRAMPELAGVISPAYYGELPKLLQQTEETRILKVNHRQVFMHAYPRLVSTYPYAYVKVSEGCQNNCAYCAIPSIRGPLRSRSIEEIVEEVEDWLAKGLKEIILVGQDISAFGEEKGENKFLDLMRELASLPSEFWLRMLYLHPARVNRDLVDLVQNEPNILPYFDLPMQHGSPSILSAMKRRTSPEKFLNLTKLIRKEIPQAFIRSTFIVGFPGEKRSDFEETVNLIKEAQLDYVGFFEYSDEEGTAASSLRNKVPRTVKKKRLEELSFLADEISFKRLDRFVGKKVKVLVEAESEGLSEGRFYGQSPQVDGSTFFSGDAKPGDWKDVLIKERVGYDLYGEAV